MKQTPSKRTNSSSRSVLPASSTLVSETQRFRQTVAQIIQFLMKEHGYSRQRATNALLREIVHITQHHCPSPWDPPRDTIYAVMRRFAITMEQATIVMTVQHAILTIAKHDKISEAQALAGIANRLEKAAPRMGLAQHEGEDPPRSHHSSSARDATQGLSLSIRSTEGSSKPPLTLLSSSSSSLSLKQHPKKMSHHSTIVNTNNSNNNGNNANTNNKTSRKTNIRTHKVPFTVTTVSTTTVTPSEEVSTGTNKRPRADSMETVAAKKRCEDANQHSSQGSATSAQEPKTRAPSPRTHKRGLDAGDAPASQRARATAATTDTMTS